MKPPAAALVVDASVLVAAVRGRSSGALVDALTVVPVTDIEAMLEESAVALRDAVASRNGSTRDAHVLALAWNIDADIWTTDCDFAGTGVATWSTPNLMRGLVRAAQEEP